MREAVRELGGDATKVNPLAPAELVIDHSVIADLFGREDAFARNVELEYERNRERYQFLRWGQTAFNEFKVVPPGTGIVHQVNIEYLARRSWSATARRTPTRSSAPTRTPRWSTAWACSAGASAASRPRRRCSASRCRMLIPRVVGFKLSGEMPAGTTATDLVLTITEMLRKHGVVGKFVEFYGPGVAAVPLANRATIGNMSPEYGSTVAIFPIDDETIKYLQLTGRADAAGRARRGVRQGAGPVARPGAPSRPTRSAWSSTSPRSSRRSPARSARRTGCRWQRQADVPVGADRLRRPQRRRGSADEACAESFPASDPPANGHVDDPADRPHEPSSRRATAPTAAPRSRCAVTGEDGTEFELDHGAVVIAAITSCTNTSNPQVMIGAALLARNAVDKGLTRKPWVKTTLAPGSKVVMDYYERAGLTPVPGEARLQPGRLRLHHLHRQLRPAARGDPRGRQRARPRRWCRCCPATATSRAASTPTCKMNYLASPPLVVAYALAGTMDIDLVNEPLGTDADGQPVYLRDIWPRAAEIDEVIGRRDRQRDVRAETTPTCSPATSAGRACPPRPATRSPGTPTSTYVRKPPYFEGMAATPSPVTDIDGARVLAKLGDSVTTDHISPAGVDQGRLARRSVPGRARRGAARLQLVRLAPRQPRGDDPRHVRQHPAAQPARARRRGRLHGQPPDRRADDDLRRLGGVRRGRRAAGRPGRQGVRLGLVARLGGQGHDAARRRGR